MDVVSCEGGREKMPVRVCGRDSMEKIDVFVHVPESDVVLAEVDSKVYSEGSGFMENYTWNCAHLGVVNWI